MSAQAQMQFLGVVDGKKWYWAAPGQFVVPGVYYWDGKENVHVPAAAPTDAKPLGLTFDGYHDSDEHFGKTILDLVRSRLDTDPDDLAEGDVFYVSACWVQPQEWRVVRSGNPFEVELVSPQAPKTEGDSSA